MGGTVLCVEYGINSEKSMSSLFDQLPPELYKSLNRWYTISAIACCITLLTISFIHLTTTLKLTHATQEYPELTQAVQKPLATPAQEAVLTASEHELNVLAAQHALFFKLFGAILSSVPQHIQLTQFTIGQKEIMCKGLASSVEEVTQFMRSLQDKVHLSITELDLQQPRSSLHAFTIRATVVPL
jgi:Tfp pilus assembly protein PilN